MAEVVVNESNFEEEVLKSDKPVLVDFWASWCGPCKMLAPTIASIAEEYKDQVKVCKCNTDENQRLAMAMRIDAIPNVILFKDGQIAGRSVGYVSKEKLVELFSK